MQASTRRTLAFLGEPNGAEQFVGVSTSSPRRTTDLRSALRPVSLTRHRLTLCSNSPDDQMASQSAIASLVTPFPVLSAPDDSANTLPFNSSSADVVTAKGYHSSFSLEPVSESFFCCLRSLNVASRLIRETLDPTSSGSFARYHLLPTIKHHFGVVSWKLMYVAKPS